MWPGPRPTPRTKLRLGPSSRLATAHEQKLAVLSPILRVGVGSPSNTISPGPSEAYLRTKWHLNPSSRLATTYVGRKMWDCASFLEGELGPHLTQCGQGRGLPPCQVAS